MGFSIRRWFWNEFPTYTESPLCLNIHYCQKGGLKGRAEQRERENCGGEQSVELELWTVEGVEVG